MEIILHKEVDAALCDITMPEKTGIQLLSELRSKGNNLPFIFLTGQTSMDFVMSALQLGVTEFL